MQKEQDHGLFRKSHTFSEKAGIRFKTLNLYYFCIFLQRNLTPILLSFLIVLLMFCFDINLGYSFLTCTMCVLLFEGYGYVLHMQKWHYLMQVIYCNLLSYGNILAYVMLVEDFPCISEVADESDIDEYHSKILGSINSGNEIDMLEKAINFVKRVKQNLNKEMGGNSEKIQRFISTALEAGARLETAFTVAIGINASAVDLIVSIERVINFNRRFEGYVYGVGLKADKGNVTEQMNKHITAYLICLEELKKEFERMA